MTDERPTRGRPSRIDRLPAPIRERLDDMLRRGATQADILRRLEGPLRDAGEPPLSRSGVNRYATRMERVGRQLREHRAIADAWTARWGEAPTGEVGQLTVEMLRTLAFEVTLRGAEGETEIDIPAIGELALAVQRLERAAAIGRAREREMREAVAAEAEQAARGAGIGADTAAAIRAAIEGTAA